MEGKYEQLNKYIQEFHKCGMSQEFLGMEDSFELAVLCQYKNDKGILVRCPHQWRVRHRALNNILEELNGQKERIASVHNFEELYKIVEETRVPYIGDLTIYDIAVRIGYLQTPQVLPQEFVYIHAGAREGVMALYRCGLIKTKPSAMMNLQDFEALARLKNIDKKQQQIPEFATYSMIIENFLCVKRKDLVTL
ncbi:MAG: hypothetical protein J6U53_00015 [Tidjanibacter sp.]|nr:hypothetical protein [Tidjanibacter sp.]